MRESFMMDTLDTHHRLPRPIKRANIYNDVIETYQENIVDNLQEYPFRIRYENKWIQGVCVQRHVFFLLGGSIPKEF